MIFSYNIRFASQKFEFVENTIMTKAENFQKVFSKNEIIVQILIEAANNVAIFNIIDSNDVIVSNCFVTKHTSKDQNRKNSRIQRAFDVRRNHDVVHQIKV